MLIREVPILLGACDILLKRSRGSPLFELIAMTGGGVTAWLILPVREIHPAERGYTVDDVDLIMGWLARGPAPRLILRGWQVKRFDRSTLALREGALALERGGAYTPLLYVPDGR